MRSQRAVKDDVKSIREMETSKTVGNVTIYSTRSLVTKEKLIGGVVDPIIESFTQEIKEKLK